MPFPITLDEIKAAYEATGLTPTQNVWATDSGCACGLSAVMAHRFSVDEARAIYGVVDERGYASEKLGISTNQVFAFTCGFDGEDPDDDDEPFEAEAYEAGKVAWEAVRGLAPATDHTDA